MKKNSEVFVFGKDVAVTPTGEGGKEKCWVTAKI